MPVVNLGDGSSFDLGDNPSPEMLARVKTVIEKNKPGVWDTIKESAKDLARGAAQGISSVVEGAANAGVSNSMIDLLGLPKPKGMSAAPVSTAVEEVMPTPPGNSFRRAALQGAGGAILSPNPVGLASSVGAGIGGEAGKRIAGQGGQIVGSVVGGFGAGGATALAARSRPQSANLAREALEGISEEQLLKAAQYQAQVRAAGHDIDLAQALQATNGGSGNLGSIRDMLASRSQGNQVQQTLRGQPQQLALEAGVTVEGMPGTNWGPALNANYVQEAATKALKQATDSRSATVKGMYAKAGDLPMQGRQELTNVIEDMINRPGATEVLKARGQEMLGKLKGQDPKLDDAVAVARAQLDAATTAPARAAARVALAKANAAVSEAQTKPLKALDVDTWISELRGPWQGQPLKVAYPKEQGQVKGLAGALNQRFQQLSPEVQKAEAEFQRITQQVVNPLKQGPIGTLNQARGYDPATQAMVSKFDSLMNRGSDPTARTSDIRTAARELNKANPEAFRDAFKGWLSRKVQGATSTGTAESPLPSDPAMAGKLYSAIFEDPLQWQGIKDAASHLTPPAGGTNAEVIRGLESLRTLTTAMKSTPSVVGGLTPADLKRIGGSSATANAVRVASFLPVNRLGEGIERAVLGKTLSQFDSILTSPEGAKMLIELGKVPVMSRKAQVILGTFAGMGANTGGLKSNNLSEKQE